MAAIISSEVVTDVAAEPPTPAPATKQRKKPGRPRKVFDTPEEQAKWDAKLKAHQVWYAAKGHEYFAKYNKENSEKIKAIRSKSQKAFRERQADQVEQERAALLTIITAIKDSAQKLGVSIIINSKTVTI